MANKKQEKHNFHVGQMVRRKMGERGKIVDIQSHDGASYIYVFDENDKQAYAYYPFELEPAPEEELREQIKEKVVALFRDAYASEIEDHRRRVSKTLTHADGMTWGLRKVLIEVCGLTPIQIHRIQDEIDTQLNYHGEFHG